MSIAYIRLLFDFGLVVLIWMVQRIVYPGFLFYSSENLLHRHRQYTARLSTVVIPLMVGQLGIALYQVFNHANLYTVISIFTVLLLWLSTFLQFVPLHNRISKGMGNEKVLKALVQKNWLRTILWTGLFIYSLACMLLESHA